MKIRYKTMLKLLLSLKMKWKWIDLNFCLASKLALSLLNLKYIRIFEFYNWHNSFHIFIIFYSLSKCKKKEEEKKQQVIVLIYFFKKTQTLIKKCWNYVTNMNNKTDEMILIFVLLIFKKSILFLLFSTK